MKKTADTGLTYTRIDLTTMLLALMTDAFPPNVPGSKSELGYLLMMTDANGKSNVIQ